MPFANLSRDPDNEYFTDGLTEEIISALASVPDIRVVARTSAFRFKGRAEDIRTIGRDLGVETALEGSVRKEGRRIRATAQLINVADGFHLWSHTYDRELTGVFSIQEDITEAIVSALQLRLAASDAANSGNVPVVPRPSPPFTAWMSLEILHNGVALRGLALALAPAVLSLAHPWGFAHSMGSGHAGVARPAFAHGLALAFGLGLGDAPSPLFELGEDVARDLHALNVVSVIAPRNWSAPGFGQKLDLDDQRWIFGTNLMPRCVRTTSRSVGERS